jgi:hypothetical protein
LPRLSELDRQTTGWIYVLAFNSGEFKIGKTFNLRGRIGQLKSELRRRTHSPAEVVDGWYSLEHHGYQINELHLLSFCMETFGAPTYGAEVFMGDFNLAIARAEELTANAQGAPCRHCGQSLASLKAIEGALT